MNAVALLAFVFSEYLGLKKYNTLVTCTLKSHVGTNMPASFQSYAISIMNSLKSNFITATLILITSAAWAQSGTIKGVITTDMNEVALGAKIINLDTKESVETDSLGNYEISIISNKKVQLKYMLPGYEAEFKRVTVADNEVQEVYVILKTLFDELEAVNYEDQSYREQAGQVRFDVKKAFINPGPNTGIEGLIKIFTGDNNELSSQYKVRGGNYDENLVYVNDFEINRPFLIRSGQQEGLSFINADLAEGVNFSVGGFQAKYGDKLSSSLDVTYKRPKKFGGSVMASLLGAQMHLEGTSKNEKLSVLFGARQKSNQYILQSQPIKGQYNPSFTDIQGLVNYKFSKEWEWELLANYARNRFTMEPTNSVEAFGYFNNVFSLNTNYRGGEIDQFDTRFAGTSLTYKPNSRTKLKLLASAFQSVEEENYDIKGIYDLYAIESDLGKSSFGDNKQSLGSGEIHDFARNRLNASVFHVGHKGTYTQGRHAMSWGAEVMFFSVDDRLLEWQRRDSAGFSQPYHPNSILMRRSVDAYNELSYQKITAYIQDNIVLGKDRNMTLNLGSRIMYTTFNNEVILSPRAQFSIAPKGKSDIIFRFASGIYAQPAFYREMRDPNGILNTDIKSQKAFHLSGGFDYNFMAWDEKPFKVTAELFYKQLWDLIPYEYDNVRIRYRANNDAKGYAYGGEVRLFGNLVKDAESWVSLGVMKTANRILNTQTNTWSAFVPRPTDQRFTLGMFFSDYLPRNKNFKAFVNVMYSSGLPFWPANTNFDPRYKLRVPDYKRVDIGFAALLLDGSKKGEYNFSPFNHFESVWLSLEVFNLLNIRNVIAYEWIQDFSNNRVYAVPDRLTARLINLKLAVRF